MLRMFLTMLFTVAICIALHDLVPNGMWLQLFLLVASSCCLTALAFVPLLRR